MLVPKTLLPSLLLLLLYNNICTVYQDEPTTEPSSHIYTNNINVYDPTMSETKMPQPIILPLPTSSKALNAAMINKISEAMDEAKIKEPAERSPSTAPAGLLGYRPRFIPHGEQYPKSYFKPEIESDAHELESQFTELEWRTGTERRGIFAQRDPSRRAAMRADGLWSIFTQHCQRSVIKDTTLKNNIEVVIPKLLDIVQRLVKELPDGENAAFRYMDDLYFATMKAEEDETKREDVHKLLLESLSLM